MKSINRFYMRCRSWGCIAHGQGANAASVRKFPLMRTYFSGPPCQGHQTFGWPAPFLGLGGRARQEGGWGTELPSPELRASEAGCSNGSNQSTDVLACSTGSIGALYADGQSHVSSCSLPMKASGDHGADQGDTWACQRASCWGRAAAQRLC